jgi:hypothetical protein
MTPDVDDPFVATSSLAPRRRSPHRVMLSASFSYQPLYPVVHGARPLGDRPGTGPVCPRRLARLSGASYPSRLAFLVVIGRELAGLMR